MNFFLFVLEIFLVVAGIALVPARTELRVSRTRVIHHEREQGNSWSVAIDSHPGKTLPKPISRKLGPAISEVKCVNLALQGGGADGAFTWGVLDRLLEEPRIEKEGVSDPRR